MQFCTKKLWLVRVFLRAFEIFNNGVGETMGLDIGEGRWVRGRRRKFPPGRPTQGKAGIGVSSADIF